MTKTDEALIDRARDAVREKFPEMSGVEVTVSTTGAQRQGKAVSPTHYVVTFQDDVLLDDGVSMRRVVRVTMNEAGDILKLSVSR